MFSESCEDSSSSLIICGVDDEYPLLNCIKSSSSFPSISVSTLDALSKFLADVLISVWYDPNSGHILIRPSALLQN